MQPTVEVVDV